MNKTCVLEDKICTNCGECNVCDIDNSKLCDNCCKCIGMEGNFASITVKAEKPKAEPRFERKRIIK